MVSNIDVVSVCVYCQGENLKLVVKEEQANNLKKLEEALDEQKTKHQVSDVFRQYPQKTNPQSCPGTYSVAPKKLQ